MMEFGECIRHNEFDYHCHHCLVATVRLLVDAITDMQAELRMHDDVIAALIGDGS